jgi:magnesium transporter
METTTRLLLPEVKSALESNPEVLLELTDELHPADLADLAMALDADVAQRMLPVLPVELAASLLEHCEEGFRSDVFAELAGSDMSTALAITDVMAPDDRADLYASLPEELRARLLENIDEEESRDIRQLLAYPEDSAGSLLTTEFVALPANATAAEAIELVRKNAAEMETIYSAYAVDIHGTLLGVVSLRDLVTSAANKPIDTIMNPNIVSTPVEADQEEVARLIAKYDLLALPVVDRSHRIVGIITVDDIIDVVQEEATEDVQKLGAVEPLDERYIDTPIWDLIRARAPWLVVLFVAVLATRNVLEHYHNLNALSVATIGMLMWFVPLIVSSGGNSGSQSATLVIRAMAVGGLELHHASRVLARELLVGLALGGIVAFVGILAVLAWDSTRSFGMAMTVSAAVIAVVTVGALLGSGIPLLLRRLGIDPAVSSTPFIASIVDIAGLFIYFEIARLLLD